MKKNKKFNSKDPILYLVTPEIGNDLESWVKIVTEAVKGGVRMVQVRDKSSSNEKIIAAIQRIQPPLKEAQIPLLINDRVDVALEVQADGVHLGQSDLAVSEARSLLGPAAIIGLSVETMDQALIAEKEAVNYVAASPLFSSFTKLDCNAPWGLEGLKRLCSLSSHPVMVIGGINKNNIASILEYPISGIAVISAIASAPCPQTATKGLIEKIKMPLYNKLGKG